MEPTINGCGAKFVAKRIGDIFFQRIACVRDKASLTKNHAVHIY